MNHLENSATRSPHQPIKLAWNKLDALALLAFLTFSTWLMFATFGYNAESNEILISRWAWSDFGSHIPLIRSFTYGQNWPPEYPLFPGPPIRYHFLFFAFVGWLERHGIRIDYALNIPSILGFFAMLSAVYLLGRTLFDDRRVGLLAALFTILNGSLTFVAFFSKHPLSRHTLQDLGGLQEYVSFAPWGPGDISAFWTLNIFTNQRHLALAFGLALFFIWFCITASQRTRSQNICWGLLWGSVLGMLPFFHKPVLLICAILGIWYFIALPRARIFLLFCGMVGSMLIIPQMLIMSRSGGTESVTWFSGYLLHDQLSTARFIEYWWNNIGLHLLFIPLGFLLCLWKRSEVCIALAPLILIFLVANLFRFSVEVAASHKFFNFAVILGGIFSAWAVVRLWAAFERQHALLIAIPFGVASVGSCVALMLSGAIDLLVIVHDHKGGVVDIPQSAAADWILHNTAPKARFLNSNYFWHPASLAGRPIFIGWPYFAWSAGYQEDRMAIMKQIYEAKDRAVMCQLLKEHKLDYLTVENTRGDPNLANIDVAYFSEHFKAEYSEPSKPFFIFSTAAICTGAAPQPALVAPS